MPFKDSLLAWFGRFIRSRVGWLLVVIHFCLLVYDFSQQDKIPADAERGGLIPSAGEVIIAERFIHWHYEPLLLKVIVLLDLPSLIVTGYISTPFVALAARLFPQPSLHFESWIVAVILLFGTSVQWLLIGYWMEVITKTLWRTRNSQLPR